MIAFEAQETCEREIARKDERRIEIEWAAGTRVRISGAVEAATESAGPPWGG